MNITPAQRPPVAVEFAAAEPRVANPAGEKEKIGEACRQFEAMLLRQVIGAAHKPAFPSAMNPQSFSKGIYQDMMTSQLADNISHAGAFGLARVLAREFMPPASPNAAAEIPASAAEANTAASPGFRRFEQSTPRTP